MADTDPAAPRETADARGPHSDAPPDPSIDGPLDRPTALALLAAADDLLDAGELGEAALRYQRVVGFPDPSVTATALLGLGTVLFRADQEPEAIATWRSVLDLPENPGTYLAYRQLAGAYVRAGELREAVDAYREADRRAPAEDRPEIASRLGWLTKELGETRASGRYFARSRSAIDRPTATLALIVVTAIISLAASFPPGAWLFDLLALDKPAVAAGEWWRLGGAMLLHDVFWRNPFHLLFNMYALWFAGALVERIYGARTMVAMYVLAGLTASTASFVFGSDIPSVGASGAVFGLFGVLIAAARAHHPVLDRRSQAVMGQIGVLVVVNLVIGFAIPFIDYYAHIGGLIAGLWLGVLFVPGRVRTLRSFWSGGNGSDGAGLPAGSARAVPLLGVVALVVVIVLGVALGTENRRLQGIGESGVGAPRAPEARDVRDA